VNFRVDAVRLFRLGEGGPCANGAGHLLIVRHAPAHGDCGVRHLGPKQAGPEDDAFGPGIAGSYSRRERVVDKFRLSEGARNTSSEHQRAGGQKVGAVHSSAELNNRKRHADKKTVTFVTIPGSNADFAGSRRYTGFG
jgi:hypothetical protein